MKAKFITTVLTAKLPPICLNILGAVANKNNEEKQINLPELKTALDNWLPINSPVPLKIEMSKGGTMLKVMLDTEAHSDDMDLILIEQQSLIAT